MPPSAAAMMLAASGVRLPQLHTNGSMPQVPPPNPQHSPKNARLGRPPTLGAQGTAGSGAGSGGKLNRMGQGPFTCNCGQVFPNLDIMERHMAALHPDNTNLPCTQCGKQFPNLTKLQRHAANHAEGPETRKFKCSRCGKAFKFKHHLKEHERIHTGEKPFECKHCGKRFSHSGSYSSHTTSKKCLQIGRRPNQGQGPNPPPQNRAGEGPPIPEGFKPGVWPPLGPHRSGKELPLSPPLTPLPPSLTRFPGAPQLPLPPQLPPPPPPHPLPLSNAPFNPTHLQSLILAAQMQNAAPRPPFLGTQPDLMENLTRFLPQLQLLQFKQQLEAQSQQAVSLNKDSPRSSDKETTSDWTDEEETKNSSPPINNNVHQGSKDSDIIKQEEMMVEDEMKEEEVVDEKANWAKRVAMMKELLGKLPGASLPNLVPNNGTPPINNADLPNRPPPMGPLGELPCKFNCGVKCSSFLELVHHHETCGDLEVTRSHQGDLDVSDHDSDCGDLNHSNSSLVNGSSESKSTRVRTLISEEQLGVLKTFYVNNPRPKREELETIAAKIGHPFKVVKVWFQNSRARDRREGKPHGGNPNHPHPHGGFPLGGLQNLLNNNSAIQESLQGLFPRIPGLSGPLGPHVGTSSHSSEDPKSPCSSSASTGEMEIDDSKAIKDQVSSIVPTTTSLPLDLSKASSKPGGIGLASIPPPPLKDNTAEEESLVNAERPESKRRPEAASQVTKAQQSSKGSRPLLEGGSAVIGTPTSLNATGESPSSPHNTFKLPASSTASATASDNDVYRFQEEIDVCGTTEQ